MTARYGGVAMSFWRLVWKLWRRGAAATGYGSARRGDLVAVLIPITIYETFENKISMQCQKSLWSGSIELRP